MLASKYLLSFNIAKIRFSCTSFSHNFFSLLIIKNLFNLIPNPGHRECCSLPQAQQSSGASSVHSPIQVTHIINSMSNIQSQFVNTELSFSSYYVRFKKNKNKNKIMQTGIYFLNIKNKADSVWVGPSLPARVWTCLLIYLGFFRHIFLNLWQAALLLFWQKEWAL